MLHVIAVYINIDIDFLLKNRTINSEKKKVGETVYKFEIGLEEH